MTKIEKGVIGAIVVLLILMIGSCVAFLHTVKKAGGLKQVVIDAGKEVKDIGREIAKD